MSIERWEIGSSQSEIYFTVRHLLFSKVRGRFSRWSGTVQVPDGDWGRAVVNVAIDASSLDTGIAVRDADLRSVNFLDVGRYPEIRFQTLRVSPGLTGGFRALGLLTMKGRVGQVPLEVEGGATRNPQKSGRATFSARARIRRGDFGASGNVVWDRFGLMIGERVEIEIAVEAVRQSASGAVPAALARSA